MKSIRAIPAAALIAAIVCGTSNAAPAAWYIWRSKLDHAQVCAQTSPGEGWQRLPTPYRNSRCEP